MTPSFETGIIGIDEVGRGAWAGPLVAAAVLFRGVPTIPDEITIRDSKRMTAAQRKRAATFIRCHADIAIVSSPCEEIDLIGIQRANAQLFQKSAAALFKRCQNMNIGIRADGRKICEFSLPYEFLVNGEQQCRAIAAASIVAKVWRDRLMTRLAKKFPQYAFERNKGYGTLEHQNALKAHGLSSIHRKSFALSCYTS